jgi:hypothetical protein
MNHSINGDTTNQEGLVEVLWKSVDKRGIFPIKTGKTPRAASL